MKEPISILLVGSNATLMGAVAVRLEYDHRFSIVGIVAELAAALESLAHRAADIVLLDVDGAGMGCLGQIETMSALHPHAQVVLLGSIPEDLFLEQAIRTGVRGVVAKDQIAGTLDIAIRDVAAGGCYYPEEVLSRIVVGVKGVNLSKPGSMPFLVEIANGFMGSRHLFEAAFQMRLQRRAQADQLSAAAHLA